MTDRTVDRTATIHGRTVLYTLSLEHLPLRDPRGQELGTLSAFSYVATPADTQRPVLFLTNGGPGSASAYLHLSGIAPVRADVPVDLEQGALGPHTLAESPSSLLDVADLVFIDAPRTGLGEVPSDADLSSVYSVEGDGAVFAQAITAWVRRHGRWNSAKYFLGESYGTQRAVFLARAAHEGGQTPLDGMALLGQAVNIQEVAERPGNVAGALANVPYKAAVAWFHGRGSRQHDTVEAAVAAALHYAWGDLAVAMLQGGALPDEALAAEARRLSDMIGIPADELVASRLWISKGSFRQKLLESDGLTLGSNDSRYTARATDPAVGESPIDAAHTRLDPQYTAAMDLLLTELLGLGDREYRFFDQEAARAWEWGDSGGRMFMQMGKPSPFHTYPYPAHLSRWMKQVPQARLFIGTGIYDSLTTIGAADHLLRQWDLPAERVESHWYHGGHMMYSDPHAGIALNDDLRAFLRGGVR